MRVVEVWRYPVKSLGGERLESALVTARGVIRDRSHGIVDVETGTVLTARRAPELLFASARLIGASVSHGVVITLPDGTRLDTSQLGRGAADIALSDWLGRRVELRAAGNDGGTYEVPLDFEHDRDWVSWQGPGLAWHDSARARVSLLSSATAGEWDVRRFRANVIVDAGDEDRFVGRRLGIGTVELDVLKHIDRCVMVTRPQPHIDRDLEVLKTINRDRGGNLAIGCLVGRAGMLMVGDQVEDRGDTPASAEPAP